MSQTCPQEDQEQALTNIEEVCADHGIELDFAALAAGMSASESAEEPDEKIEEDVPKKPKRTL